MTEDVLEQVVDDYLRSRGYFTRTNVRFGPRKGDGSDYDSKLHNQQSDIDVLAVKRSRRGPRRVLAVTCKAMQEGYSPACWFAAAKTKSTYKGRRGEKSRNHQRELWDDTWNKYHRLRVKELTGAVAYTYVLAVTKVDADPKPGTKFARALGQRWLDRGGSAADLEVWREEPEVARRLVGLDTLLLTFESMWNLLRCDVSTAIEPSHVGRLSQMLNAIEARPTRAIDDPLA